MTTEEVAQPLSAGLVMAGADGGCGAATLKATVAGVGSGVPDLTARTAKTWLPAPRRLYAFGAVQGAGAPVIDPGPSSRHSKLAALSLAANENEEEAPVVELV